MGERFAFYALPVTIFIHKLCYHIGMGEYAQYQPLTRRDRVTVVVYRAGIVLSAVLVSAGAYALLAGRAGPGLYNALLALLYVAVGLSVFFIHLYVSSFHRFLKILYALSLAALAGLYGAPGGPAGFMSAHPAGFFLLLPLSGCLGFVTAKEAFCFRQYEGYALALFMPFYLLVLSTGRAPQVVAAFGLSAIAAMLVLFTIRKVFMPLHCDIGDKSAYQ
jgi:uncharacterized integral membrane protein